jgi:hypothetical protein
MWEFQTRIDPLARLSSCATLRVWQGSCLGQAASLSCLETRRRRNGLLGRNGKFQQQLLLEQSQSLQAWKCEISV